VKVSKSHGLSTPAQATSARATEITSMNTSAAIISTLRWMISASDPDAIASNMTGNVFDACTRAISVALSVSCVISHAAPTA
jgi:hypothetical protein